MTRVMILMFGLGMNSMQKNLIISSSQKSQSTLITLSCLKLPLYGEKEEIAELIIQST